MGQTDGRIIVAKGTEIDVDNAANSVAVIGSDTAMVRAHVITLMESIPFADDDPHGITAAILNADSWEEFADGASSLPKAELVQGLHLKINDVTRRDSDLTPSDDEFSLNLPWYLVIDSTDTRTGDKIMWQTSAETIVAKLCKLYDMGLYPVHVILSKASKPTKRGFYPMNMTVESVTPKA